MLDQAFMPSYEKGSRRSVTCENYHTVGTGTAAGVGSVRAAGSGTGHATCSRCGPDARFSAGGLTYCRQPALAALPLPARADPQ